MRDEFVVIGGHFVLLWVTGDAHRQGVRGPRRGSGSPGAGEGKGARETGRHQGKCETESRAALLPSPVSLLPLPFPFTRFDLGPLTVTPLAYFAARDLIPDRRAAAADGRTDQCALFALRECTDAGADRSRRADDRGALLHRAALAATGSW